MTVTKQLVLKQVIILFYLLSWVWPAASENFPQQLLLAHTQKLAAPHYSLAAAQANESQAYKVQQKYVKLRSGKDPIAGYKAGLTSTAGQQKFNVSQALSGVLFASGHVADPHTVSLKSAGKLMLETELGFILAKPIKQPVKDIVQLKQAFESVVAVVELPDIGFEQPKKITGVDLIAANVASHQFIIGEKKPLNKIVNINQLTTRLSHDNQVQFNGKAIDALGDQWQALLWLTNQLVSQGHQLSAGDLLITGALGKMIPAQPGNYLAEFDQLGQIQFTVH
ncbi:2-keto-4-pentenoate hydratase [Aliikangiella coralliicola]|uniref:4-oxalocrotonate decarboxylase n=1 Tax=Aliikangiella coralliicola TaxID=2592383 RepID=A0A545UG18_9GAMM|nr:fumarylacetoacetate hydrolase family protein [Aliikangiella coralliicola]TQV88422.1 4-oxalocrotonate decarboxylase [Aliikangiella coralliicola]